VNFTYMDSYHDQSACGRYTICRVRNNGILFHEAWYIGGEAARCLGMGLEHSDALSFCDHHAERQLQQQTTETSFALTADAR
jgi:hypothetical protein